MNGTQLKEKTALRRAVEALRRAAVSRPGRAVLALSAYGAAGFLLAALPLFGKPLPLAACLALCTGVWPGFGAALGACGGYILLWGWELAMEPLALCLSALAGTALFRRTPVSRPLLAAGLSLAVGGLFLLDTGLSLGGLLRLSLGAGMAALLPRLHRRAVERGEPGASLGAGALLLLSGASLGGPVGPALALGAALALSELRALPLPADAVPAMGELRAFPAQRGVEKALLTMHGVLAREEPLLQPLQLAEVYDFAAEQVCRCCVGFSRCWEQNAEETYRDLCAAGDAILQRGAALREDLPERFTERCRHTAGFVTAVNQAMDAQLSRRREERRRSEGRRVAAGQYLALERLLTALSRPQPREALRYAPELAVGSACKPGGEVSGDRGATCKDRFGAFYVLLCDGMGTGAPARRESDRAARLLTAFLEAGMEADAALELVNGFFVLRRETAFATLDLLKLDLRTGSGVLYKWGAPPSYLRRGAEVETIGTATAPPGLDAERRVPGQYALSLTEGETLVMVSDGAFGEETAQRLRIFAQGSVRDLASCLITLGEADAADDRTVVAVRLRPLETNL